MEFDLLFPYELMMIAIAINTPQNKANLGYASTLNRPLVISPVGLK